MIIELETLMWFENHGLSTNFAWWKQKLLIVKLIGLSFSFWPESCYMCNVLNKSYL